MRDAKKFQSRGKSLNKRVECPRIAPNLFRDALDINSVRTRSDTRRGHKYDRTSEDACQEPWVLGKGRGVAKKLNPLNSLL